MNCLRSDFHFFRWLEACLDMLAATFYEDSVSENLSTGMTNVSIFTVIMLKMNFNYYLTPGNKNICLHFMPHQKLKEHSCKWLYILILIPLPWNRNIEEDNLSIFFSFVIEQTRHLYQICFFIEHYRTVKKATLVLNRLSSWNKSILKLVNVIK